MWLQKQLSAFHYFPRFIKLPRYRWLIWYHVHFDRCLHNTAAETPVKYGRDLKALVYTFAIKISRQEETKEGSLSNPHPKRVNIFAMFNVHMHFRYLF